MRSSFRIVLSISTAAMVFTVASAVLAAPDAPAAPAATNATSTPAPNKVGVLGNVQGQATATGADNTTRTLKAGDDIFEGDVIRTDGKSNAQVLFLDRSALTLTPDSEVKMDRFVYNPASTQGELSIEEAKGAFRFIGGALSKQNHVEIKTPVSTIGIRGGIEETHVAPGGDNADAIFVYGHDMTVKDKKGRNLVVTEFGGGAKVRKGGAGPLKMSAHEVAGRFRHFSRINREPGRIQRRAAARMHAKALKNEHRRDLGHAKAPNNEHRRDFGKERREKSKEALGEVRNHTEEKAVHRHAEQSKRQNERKAQWDKLRSKAGGERQHRKRSRD